MIRNAISSSVRNGFRKTRECKVTMIRLLVIVYFAIAVKMETRSVQYNAHISRKLRSNTGPLQLEYVHSHVHDPRALATIEKGASGFKSVVKPYTEHSDSTKKTSFGDSYHTQYSDRSINYDRPPIDKYKDLSNVHYNNYLTVTNKPVSKYTKPPYLTPIKAFIEPLLSQYNVEYAQAKAKSKFSSDYVPSKMKSDATYERLKSLMHYRLPPDAMLNEYHFNNIQDFHSDDDDIRTSSSPYENWPYFYHSPYEYLNTKTDSVVQKVKDKRFAMDTARKIIPVHEDAYHDHSGGSEYSAQLTPSYDTTTPDNPISGHQPFFSFVLNDYFDKNTDDDALTFKGLNVDNEFDYELESNNDADDYGKRNRRLQNNYDYHDYDNIPSTNFDPNHNYGNIKESQGETNSDTGFDRKHEFDKYEKGHKYNSNRKSQYDDKSNRLKGFKNFVDTFANNFGSQNTNKKSNYILSRNQDKGEKRKGFRRVYHKDEYQEDNEFYDNTHNSAKADEKGETAVHTGGTEAYLRSHSAANLGNDTNAHHKAGNSVKNDYENKHSGHTNINGSESEIKKYRDVARKAAQSNDADYSDHYRINKL